LVPRSPNKKKQKINVPNTLERLVVEFARVSGNKLETEAIPSLTVVESAWEETFTASELNVSSSAPAVLVVEIEFKVYSLVEISGSTCCAGVVAEKLSVLVDDITELKSDLPSVSNVTFTIVSGIFDDSATRPKVNVKAVVVEFEAVVIIDAVLDAAFSRALELIKGVEISL
jgi:hypothetical protein